MKIDVIYVNRELDMRVILLFLFYDIDVCYD